MAEPDEKRAVDLTGPERAAILLLVLGEDFGSPLWSSLDDDELRKVTLAMSTLGTKLTNTFTNVSNNMNVS